VVVPMPLLSLRDPEETKNDLLNVEGVFHKSCLKIMCTICRYLFYNGVPSMTIKRHFKYSYNPM